MGGSRVAPTTSFAAERSQVRTAKPSGAHAFYPVINGVHSSALPAHSQAPEPSHIATLGCCPIRPMSLATFSLQRRTPPTLWQHSSIFRPLSAWQREHLRPAPRVSLIDCSSGFSFLSKVIFSP